MATRIRRRALIVLLVVGMAVAAQAVTLRLERVHAYGGEWTLFPSAAPPEVGFAGRHYRRGAAETADLPTGYAQTGTTMGGGRIYASSNETGTHLVLYVRGDDRLYGYGLVGGP